MSPALRLTAALLAGLTALGCSAAGTPSAAPSRSPSPPPATASAPASPSLSPVPSPPATVTLAFAGDVHFAGRVAPRLADPATALGPIAAVLGSADVAMVNLETAITERGTPEPKSFHFRAPPTALDALAAAGVDVATIANNHAVDYGPLGLADTLAAVRGSAVPVVGIGRDARHAYAPWTATVHGTRIAILAASQVPDRTAATWMAGAESPGIATALDPDRLLAAVRSARADADLVVVYLHWGTEGVACPTAAQRTLARQLAQAGADAVVGTHAHLLLGGGWLGSTYVAYGLGNFLWWRDNAYSNDTGVLELTARDGRVVGARFIPAHIDPRGVPLAQSGAAGERIAAKWRALRGCSGLSAAPTP